MKAVYLPLIILLFSSPVSAQDEPGPADEKDEEVTPKPAKSKKKKVKKKSKADQQQPADKVAAQDPGKRTSRMNRASKKIGLGAELGAMFSSTAGGGLEFSLNSNDSLQLGGGFSYGKQDLSSQAADDDQTANSGSSSGSTSTKSTIETEELDLSFTYVNATGKYFLGNSFYFSAGLGYRIVETNIRVVSLVDTTYIDTNTKSSSICLDIGLGNRWTFDSGLYIGGNWFAAVIPLSSSYTATSEAGGAANEILNDIAEDNKELARKIGTTEHYRLAVFQIGFSF